MKNIEKFSVANLDTREMRDINGGDKFTHDLGKWLGHIAREIEDFFTI